MRFVLTGPNSGKSGVWGGFEFVSGDCEAPDTPVVRNLLSYWAAYPASEVSAVRVPEDNPEEGSTRKPGRPRKA